MTERWRCFVAIPIDSEVRDAIAAAVRDWEAEPAPGGLRWTDAEGWHVTLAFLGSVETDAIAGIAQRIADVAATHPPMTLEIGGLGAFPSPGRARVAWLGVDDADAGLGRLAADLRSALGEDLGGQFRGHLTLARARRAPVDVRGWLRSAVSPRASWRATTVELMRSHLGGGPARYEVLATASLGVPAHV